MKTNRTKHRHSILALRLLAPAFAIWIGTTLQAQQLAAPIKRPNILMIVADDMN